MSAIWTKRRILILLCALPLSLALAACGDDDDAGGGDAGTDTGTDSDTDSDTDGDTDSESEGCSEIDWGSMPNVGSIPSNWEMMGWADQNLDGTLSEDEMTEVAFTLEDIHCLGKQSLIWLISDKY